MNKTKSRILDASRQLFNKKGFSDVTIRMIAAELSMSSGNLNYHYKKREDILEALYFEMVEVFDKRVEDLGNKPISLIMVKEDVISSLKRMIDYRFFWTDLYNLLRLNHKIKEHFLKVYDERKNGTRYLFEVLQSMNLMNEFKFNKESDFLIERMITYSNTWLYNSFIYDVEINEKYVESHAEKLIGMLYPYFTEKGKNQFKALFPELF